MYASGVQRAPVEPQPPSPRSELSSVVHFVPLHRLDPLDHELRDAVAALDLERLGRIRVDEQHRDLVAVARVDEAGRVQTRDAVLQRESRARLDEAGVALRDRERDAGRDGGAATPGREHCPVPGEEVQPRVAFVLRRRAAGARDRGGERGSAPARSYAVARRSPSNSARCDSVSSTSSRYAGWSRTMCTGPLCERRRPARP